MNKSVWMKFLLPTPILQRGDIFVFLLSLERTTYEVDHPWYFSYHGELLGVLSSNFAILKSTRRSPMREQHGTITALYLVTIDIEVLGVVDKSIYLLIFYKHIQASSEVMRSCMFYPWSKCCSDGPHIFSFACQRRASWGQPARRLLLPFGYWQYWHGWILPNICFYKVYLNTLDSCLHWLLSHLQSGKSIEGSAPFLRVLLFFDVSNIFRGGFEVVRESY